MSEKPVTPDQDATRADADAEAARKDAEFRLLCRRYSRLRARTPR